MLKRTLIVIAVAVVSLFMPWLIGEIFFKHDYSYTPFIRYITGVGCLAGFIGIVMLLMVLFNVIVDYIKYG